MTAVPDIVKLKAARVLVARPGGWMQGAFCKNPDGSLARFESVMSPNAQCFCAEGAIAHVKGARWGAEGCALVNAHNSGQPTFEWNDAPGRTQTEVVAAFDRAIELVEANYVV